MKTVSRHIPPNMRPGDYRSVCDYCGGVFWKSDLRRDGGGLLYCEFEGEGLDATTLDQELAASQAPPMEYPPADSRLEPKLTEVNPGHPELVGPTGGYTL